MEKILILKGKKEIELVGGAILDVYQNYVCDDMALTAKGKKIKRKLEAILNKFEKVIGEGRYAK
jgi:hypothetical protein